jgi:hypothetical protein
VICTLLEISGVALHMSIRTKDLYAPTLRLIRAFAHRKQRLMELTVRPIKLDDVSVLCSSESGGVYMQERGLGNFQRNRISA